MKKIYVSTFFSLFLSCCIVFFSSLPSPAYMTVSDQTEVEEVDVEDSIEFASPSQSLDIINFNIFEDIALARELLENRKCGFQVVKSQKSKKLKKGKKRGKGEKGSKNELGEFTILLAVENIKNREIRVIRVHPKLGAKSEGVVVEPGKSNGVNTKFTIVYPEHHIVLAIRRPVRHGTTFREVIYTPYSESLDIPHVRSAGLEYLKDTLKMVKNDLTNRRVRPLSGDKFVENDVSLALAIVEHIDPLKFESGDYTAEKLIHETLVILGTNKQNAYRYSVSKAGARGLFQFIPNTYKRIVRLYPQAELNKNFIQGMEDHQNAAKAAFLLFDADMRIVNNGRNEQLVNEPQALGRLLASAYNCGSGKTKTALDRYGENWHSRVPAETKIYLKKFDAVWEWLRSQPEAIQ